MTFSQIAKEEIRKNIHFNKSCCGYSCLYAILRCIGNYSIVPNSIGMTVSSENHELVHMASQIASNLFGTTNTIGNETANPLRGNAVYTVAFDMSVLEFYGLVYRDADGSIQLGSDSWAYGVENSQCCTKALLQTAFVACGSVMIPDSDGCGRYHMEIVLSNDSVAQHILQLLVSQGYRCKSTQRKNNTVLYVKDSEQISDMLVYLGAGSSNLILETVMVDRAMRNTITRQTNCINANIDRQVESNSRHMDAIMMLSQRNMLDSLPNQLREVALARMQYQEVSLAELADLCNMSKSGIRHRLNKLVQLAEDIRQ